MPDIAEEPPSNKNKNNAVTLTRDPNFFDAMTFYGHHGISDITGKEPKGTFFTWAPKESRDQFSCVLSVACHNSDYFNASNIIINEKGWIIKLKETSDTEAEQFNIEGLTLMQMIHKYLLISTVLTFLSAPSKPVSMHLSIRWLKELSPGDVFSPLLNGIAEFDQSDFEAVKALKKFQSGHFSSVRFIPSETNFQGVKIVLPKHAVLKTVDLMSPLIDHLKLMDEALLWYRCRNSKHVVQMFGACYYDGTSILIESGLTSLYCFLHRHQGKIGQAIKLRFAKEAAKALVYMCTFKVLHCKVQAKSFYLDEKLSLKIGDFDCADAINMHKKTNDYDISLTKWTPPETLINKVYNVKSEVWSYGILAWEIDSEGAEPYPQYIKSMVKAKLKKHRNVTCGYKGFTLAMPERIPEAIAELIKKCVNHCPCCRPSIAAVYKELHELYEKWMC